MGKASVVCSSSAVYNGARSHRYEHETELLREQLRQREQDRERQKRSWEMAERAADERREAERAQLQRQEEELSARMRLQDDELRRRQQENTLFVQVGCLPRLGSGGISVSVCHIHFGQFFINGRIHRINIFQAQRLNSMLDRQEQGMFDHQQPMVSTFFIWMKKRTMEQLYLE